MQCRCNVGKRQRNKKKKIVSLSSSTNQQQISYSFNQIFNQSDEMKYAIVNAAMSC